MKSDLFFCYKLAFRRVFISLYFVIFLMTSYRCGAQDTALNKYGLYVIESESGYRKSIENHPEKLMVDVVNSVPGIVLDLRYAGKNNFLHERLYSHSTSTFLRLRAVMALAGVQRELNEKKLGLMIWDAYRPYSVTEKMWEQVKDDRYTADPKKGSGHNRGIAVDVTIIDTLTKAPLLMGTEYDNFSDTAHQDFKHLPASVLANRALLRTTMEKYGFKALETEWWHFYLQSGENFELLDIPFRVMSRITHQK
jgi:D-alanyl-D-alanine dipeptidase